MDVVRTLRLVSIAEATSFLLLLAAAVIKRTSDAPLGVQVLGPIHGALFLTYIAAVLIARNKLGWNATKTALALGAGVLPVAPFYVERRWVRPAPA